MAPPGPAGLKQAFLEALRDPEFRAAVWHELVTDTVRAARRSPGPAHTISEAGDLKALMSRRRQGG